MNVIVIVIVNVNVNVSVIANVIIIETLVEMILIIIETFVGNNT